MFQTCQNVNYESEIVASTVTDICNERKVVLLQSSQSEKFYSKWTIMRIFHVLGLSRLQTLFAALLVLAVFTFVWHYSLNRTPAPANSRSGKLTDFSGYCSAASFNGRHAGALINLRFVVLLAKISKSLVKGHRHHSQSDATQAVPR